MRTLYACSGNPGKLAEFTQAAQFACPGQYAIFALPGLGTISPPEETAATFEGNAVLKALYYSAYTGELVFADDSGLEVAALGGAPGVLSARFAGPSASSVENNRLLREKLEGQVDRSARFVTVIALAQAGRLLTTAAGTVAGEILLEPRGHLGFGYDPVFFYPPLGRSFAELEGPEKFAVSARGNAFRGLLAGLGNAPF